MVTTPPRPEIQQIEHDYRRNVAIVEARPKLVQAALFGWLLLDIALLLYFLISVILYLVAGSFAETRDIASIGQNAGVARDAAVARVAQPLLLADTRVLSRDAAAYDMYTTVENVNADWYATITYAFVDGTLTTPTQETTIMPGATQYVYALNVAAAARPAGAELVVADVAWTRIDKHDVADTAVFLAEHEDFVLSEGTYAPDVKLEKETVGRSSFTLQNASSYAYYRPTFLVLLKRGGAIVAINQVTVPQFLAGEVREMAVHWFGSIPTAGTVEAVPIIDYFDPDAFMDPEGVQGEDVRDRNLDD